MTSKNFVKIPSNKELYNEQKMLQERKRQSKESN
jgi:hypothetical protein